jgi:hypothetical protein
MLGAVCKWKSQLAPHHAIFQIGHVPATVVAKALMSMSLGAGTSLLSAGKTIHIDNIASKDTLSDCLLSFVANGFVGGLQKKLKSLTASMGPTTYDFFVLFPAWPKWSRPVTMIGTLISEREWPSFNFPFQLFRPKPHHRLALRC